MSNASFARVLSSLWLFSLIACAPLPTRDDVDAFQSKLHGTVATTDTALFMDCVVDGFNRTDNAIRYDIKTTQQRRSSGYRIERRSNLIHMLLIVSADISDVGDVELFENMRLPSISPFVSTKQEIAAFAGCLNQFQS